MFIAHTGILNVFLLKNTPHSLPIPCGNFIFAKTKLHLHRFNLFGLLKKHRNIKLN